MPPLFLQLAHGACLGGLVGRLRDRPGKRIGGSTFRVSKETGPGGEAADPCIVPNLPRVRQRPDEGAGGRRP